MKIKMMMAVSLLALMPLSAQAVIYQTDPGDDEDTTTTTTTTTVASPTTTVIEERPVAVPGQPVIVPDNHTVVTDTHWVTQENGAYVLNVIDPTLVKSGGLTNREIGRVLFRIYDNDGNGVLDSNEWEHRVAIHVVPVEKDTVISYHYDENGDLDKTQYTYRTFLQNSLLARYEANPQGLSPHEFTGRNFMEADVNHDHAVDLKEWIGTYNANIDAINKRSAETNK